MLTYFNPLSWFRWFGEFIYSWVLSIPWRDAPKAIPAIILLVVLFAAGIAALAEGGWRNRLLNKQLNAAKIQEDYDTAELVVRRQLSGAPHDATIAYRLGTTMYDQGRKDEAVVLMKRLANRKQYPNAAIWLVEKHYKNMMLGDLSPEEQDEFGALLRLIVTHKTDLKYLKYEALYGDYLVARKKYREAIPILDKLSQYQPLRGFQAAAISRRLGNHSTANQFAKKSLETVQGILAEDPSNAGIAMTVAQNQLFLKEYENAFETLKRTLEAVKTKEEAARLNQAIADTLVAWVANIKDVSTDTKVQRVRIMKMLEFALKTAPTNPRVLTMVADQVLATLRDDDLEVTKRRELLIAGSAPGIQHFVEGTSALMNDKMDDAILHLTIASELMPKSNAILNNLAVALASREEPDLEKALKVSNQAIAMTPTITPHFYETRGQILYMDKQYLKAIPDLTRALKLKSLAPKAHQSLSECYKSLGKDDLAKHHAEAAEKITESLNRVQ